MHSIQQFVQMILHLNLYLGQWVNQYGLWSYALLFLVIFCETGVVVLPFLPGDSLLFAAGSVWASGRLEVHGLVALLIVAAVCGDNVNYGLGRWLGPKVFQRDRGWLNAKHLQETHLFYERYGRKAIILARFIPIVRTFVPFIAGIGRMRYRSFLGLSIIAAMLWVGLLVYVGYYFGNIPLVKNHFSVVIAAIIVISLLPPVIKVLKARRRADRGRSAP